MSKFFKYHVLFPAIAFGILAPCFEIFQWDLPIADLIVKLEGDPRGKFALEHNFITEQVIHVGGKYFSILIGVAVLVFFIISLFKKKYHQLRIPFIFLILSTVLTLVVISKLKSWTNVDCPWDLQRYGGHNPYIRIFEPHPGTFKSDRGFPASHSGSGFMWIALYYFFMAVNSKYRFKGLYFGVGLGLIFGIGQQLRGAHFLSHDLWSVAICWVFSTGFYYLLLRKRVENECKQTT